MKTINSAPVVLVPLAIACVIVAGLLWLVL